MNCVYLGIGSNLGDKEGNISEAINLLREEVRVNKVSQLFETAPVGYLDQPAFLNGAIEIETEKCPISLLAFLHAIEQQLGRVRSIINGPRPIDLDILLYNDIIVQTEKLVIPHARMHERLFVLEPLAEIAADKIHPTLNISIYELLKSLQSRRQVNSN